MQPADNQPPDTDTWQAPKSLGEYNPLATNSGENNGAAQPESDNASSDMSPETNAPEDALADTEILAWQATAGTNHSRPLLWYILLGVAVVALVLIAILVLKSWSFAALVPVMALALVVYAHRSPQATHYVLNNQGVHIGDHLSSYASFRSFVLTRTATTNMISLTPKKRFALAEVIYFPDDIGEQVVDMLASRLPMNERKPDLIDRMISKLRL